MKLETGNWKLGVMVLAVLSGLSGQAGPLGIQKMTDGEAIDTVLNEGEVVAIATETDPATVHLRYGDGETAGGIIVADPYAVQSAYHRALSRSEYSVVMSGRATVTNGVYWLLTAGAASAYDAANVGALTIRPRAAGTLLSGVSYVRDDYASYFSEDEYPDYTAGATNIVLSAQQIQMPPIVGGTVLSVVSNLAVYGWVGTHLIGSTNDCRGTVLLVMDAASDAEALNLGTHNRLMANHRAENWSLYAATQAVDMAWQDVWLSPYARLTGTAKGADLALTTPNGMLITNALSIHYDRQACTIVGYILGATNVTLLIEAGVTMTNAPVIMATTSNLTSAIWTARVTATDWPTETWYTASSGRRFQTWTLTANKTPGAAQEFFKVQGYPAPATNSVTVNLPLIPAGGITMGAVTVKSWAELKAVLEALP